MCIMKLNLLCVLLTVGVFSLESKPRSGATELPTFTQGHTAPNPVSYTNNSQSFNISHGIQKPPDPCNYKVTDQVFIDYRNAIHNLAIPIIKKAAQLSRGHFVMSAHTIWLTLAALAEGASEMIQKQLFQDLKLSSKICERQLFYHIATTREYSTSDVILARNRFFISDSGVQINKKWEDYVKVQTHLNTMLAPFKSNPLEIENLKKLYKMNVTNIDISGNSIILESMDYHGLWADSFTDAVIQEGPFYNNFGEPIGNMEYMIVTKKAYIGYVPGINMKVLDLPVGREGRYRMHFSISEGNEEYVPALDKIKQNLLIETVLSLRKTMEAVDIVIPKLTMTSEVDVRMLLEEIGIKSLWMDPYATRNISEPAALPSAYIQRVTIALDNNGVHPSLLQNQNLKPTIPSFVSFTNRTSDLPENSYAKSFIVNKPFFFGLVDSETLTSIFSASFSRP